MLSLANIDIVETLSWFRSKGFKVSFLVPTETSLVKSIMDATKDFREFLSSQNLHIYEDQQQGTKNKKLIETILISKNQIYKTQTSLYRPQTKDGDPRLWIYELSKHSKGGDLLAVLISENKLIVINCSNSNLNELENILINDAEILSFNTSLISDELLTKLKDISSRGFIKSMKSGDTGIGYTIETLLGIKANSSKNPDYKGIEIKSSRSRSQKGDLFNMAPNWALSNLKSADEIIHKHGRPNPQHNNLKTIFHTIRGNKENNWGLKLEVDETFIHQVFINESTKDNDICWLLSDFVERIKTKHKETFWIDAETRGSKDNEEFHFKKVIHTGDIDISIIPTLIETGKITLDYLLWERIDGWRKYKSKSAFDYKWKLSSKKNRNLLFKFIKEYPL